MASNGSGVTMTYGTTGFAPTVQSIDTLSINGEEIITTNLATSDGLTAAFETAIPGKILKVELGLTIQYDAGTAVPINQDPEAITLTFPNTNTISGSGFNKSFDLGALENDTLQTASISVKMTGTLTGVVSGFMS